MDTLFQILSDFFKWVLSFFTALCSKVITGIISAVLLFVPDEHFNTFRSNYQTIADYVNIVNAWVPLDLGFSLFILYIGVIFSDRGFKMFMKLF